MSNMQMGRIMSLAVAMPFLAAASGFPMSPAPKGDSSAGTGRKFIGLCFDTMFNSPSNILAHADALDAVPWLDGLAIGLRDIVLRAQGDSTITTETCRLMQRGVRWTHEAIAGELPVFREIVRHPSMRESFLLAWISPAGKSNRIAWNDDEEWKLFADNMATLAWFAKEAGLKGLMLDPEEYSGALQYLYQPGDASSFKECSMLARQRGREVFSAVFREYPDICLFFLWTMEHHVRAFSGRGETDPRQISDDCGELLPYFYNGMLDVIPPEARFVDGAEHYSLSATKDMYWKGALNQLVGARSFVAPENWAKYRAQILAGNTHYLDMFSVSANPKSHWYHGPVDGSRLEHLRRNVEQSIQSADEYVWIYGENGRLIDWKGGPTKHQGANVRLWEDQIPGLSETLLMAKDPDRLMELRMAERRRDGTLANLAEGQLALPCSSSLEDSVRHMELAPPPSVKGVRPGERYIVRQRYRFALREGAPSLRVAWRKGGQPVAEKAAAAMSDEPSKPGDWRWARVCATVPEGADELVVEVAADLFPGDTVSAAATEVFKLEDAPAAAGALADAKPAVTPLPAASTHKWAFDEAAKKLSDGNWTLSAAYARGDPSKSTLAVNGNGASGAGVLDFRRVEADTGKKVVFISGFARNQAITALVAPDLTAVGMDGLKFCNSLRSVAVSPDVGQLAMSCFAYSTNLVHFSPTTFKETALLGGSAFLGCTSLTGDFSYAGTNAVPGALFQDTAITSFRAPRCRSLGQRCLAGCRKLETAVFAEDMAFADDEARTAYLMGERGRAGLLVNLMPKNNRAGELKTQRSLAARLSPAPCVKGVRPGELYGVSLSMKATAIGGSPFFRVKWRGEGRPLAWDTERPFAMKGPRADGVWRTGGILVRVPQGADELVLDAGADVRPGDSFTFDKVEIFKLGDPPPAWPEGSEQPKQ